jgi:hypothetical protein
MARPNAPTATPRGRCQVPTISRSVRRIAIVAERGRPPFSLSGQELIAFGLFGSLRPGCVRAQVASSADRVARNRRSRLTEDFGLASPLSQVG